MKKIYNWRYATVADVEADGLLEEATKIHVVGCKLQDGQKVHLKGNEFDRINKFLDYHIDNELPVVGHNFILYDVPLFEKILERDLSELMVIDTLSLSWYLNFDRKQHGLDSFFDDYGIEKPAIDDWENLSYDEYKHRVSQDVDINTALWEDFKERLIEMYTEAKGAIDSGKAINKRISPDEHMKVDEYKELSVDEHIDRFLTFLMFKTDTSRLREKTRILIDQGLLESTDKELESKVKEAASSLEGAMPKVPKYGVKKKPKKPYKKDGSLSASGESWNEAIKGLKEKDELGNPLSLEVEGKPDELKILKKYEEPNINSHEQIKSWLFSHGWEPESFNFVKDKDAQQAWADSGFKKELKPNPRKVPQISIEGEEGKELCPSVKKLAEKIPEIKVYEGYTLIKHRYDTIQGFKREMSNDGYVQARVGGFTNTLREQHRVPIVNLPSVSKPYGANIRGLLSCEEDETMLGSDLSSLEDRVKNHFCLAHDPEYVESISVEGFDPHVFMCQAAGYISEKEMSEWFKGNKTQNVREVRPLGKTVNYSCLPVDSTEVLTSEGWKKYNDLREGDAVISYNSKKDALEEDKILKTHYFKSQEVIKLGHSHQDFESTPDHRWYGWKRKYKPGTKERHKDWGFFTTSEINQEYGILGSAPYINGRPCNFTEDECALLGWVLSDGHYKWSEKRDITSSSFGKKKGLLATVHQAEHKYCGEIEDLLSRLNYNYTKRLHSDCNAYKVYSYKLPPKEFRELLDKVDPSRKQKHEVDWVKWILSLDQNCIEAFVYNFWLADGDSKGNDYSISPRITQNEGNISEALRLAMYLRGKRISVSGKGESACKQIRQLRSRWMTMQEVKEKSRRLVDVFCLTTNNSTFVVRQGNFLSITGNCVYGAGPETIARSGGMSLKDAKALHKAYWEVHWYVKAIAEEQCVFKDSRGNRWLVNPINGFCYNIRSDKDIFSTLIQGTGSFFFDCWVDNIISEMYRRWGKAIMQILYHDEVAFKIKDLQKNRELFENIVLQAIEKVNEDYYTRVPLGCDVQYGNSYAEIH